MSVPDPEQPPGHREFPRFRPTLPAHASRRASTNLADSAGQRMRIRAGLESTALITRHLQL